MNCLISLIGEQPIPNLLVARALQPDRNLLYYTRKTEPVAENLKVLLSNPELHPLPPFDLTGALSELERACPPGATINLTGGTKTMALAAYEFARRKSLPCVYLESDQGQSHLYQYAFQDNQPHLQADSILPTLITIEDYLRAYLGDGFGPKLRPTQGPGKIFEDRLQEALRPVVDEIKAGIAIMAEVDIDLVIRCANQVGIIEAKVGHDKIKHALDQLNTAGGQVKLGTYTQKILVSDQSWKQHTNHRELAQARRITVIEVPSFQAGQQFSLQDTQHLQTMVCKALGRPLPIPNQKS
jgi:hypothetical protein